MKTVLMRVGLLAAGLTYAAGALALARVAPLVAEAGVPAAAVPVIGWLWGAAALLLLAGAVLLDRVPTGTRALRAAQPRTSLRY
jgi:hypothetical protein